ncbi:interferon-induced very large GTPase 1-like [Salarias fasciatus]|uniref:Interferon-induced very large GTPase 1-like n=1 Tax=Salarias fasciatus TaxID=181472 RepID=A0A672I9X6_SALFA|nr:interferon-induced very large GTPase 1-like [Salarias fasciatus]
MSLKLSKRPSSKKKKLLKVNAQTEIFHKLGLETYWTTPLDPASILDISTWTLKSQTALTPQDLPKSFLQRLWALRKDARSTSCKTPQNVDGDDKSPQENCNGSEEEIQPVVHPLDLVTAVFMSSNTFLHQEITMRMAQCQFAIPLILPNIDPDEPSNFLLWPLRSVVSQWLSHSVGDNKKVHEGDLASTCMPMVSCIKLGHCGISKSQVLNHIMSGPRSDRETFLHKGLDGGQLPRRLSNGLVELGWYLPSGDINKDNLPIPMVISNLRGDASAHEKCFSLLCQASSVVVAFCGDLREKERQLLLSCKHMACKLILIDLSDSEMNENRVVGFVGHNLEEHMGLPEGSVISGKSLDENELANKLCNSLKNLLPDQVRLVTLEAAAQLAAEVGFNVDEGSVCKKAMTTVDEVLKGLDGGSSEFKMKQLPLQGPLWIRLSQIEKEESKQKKEGQEIDSQMLKEKKDILAELRSYKMTPSMKIFTDSLFTADKVERTYFLNWLKMKLHLMQTAKHNDPQEHFAYLHVERSEDTPEHLNPQKNGVSGNTDDTDSFCTDSTFEEEMDVSPGGNEFQVSEEECEKGKKSPHILPTADKTQEKEELQSIHTPVIMQELDAASNEKILETTSVCDEQIHPQGSETQVCQSEENDAVSCDRKQPDEPEVTLAMPEADSTFEQQASLETSSEYQLQPFELDPSSLGLEHFLREMGLIFELTHVNPGSGSHNVLRLPSLAADLLLYGVPLELMDGDASSIPACWLSCVFAELKRRLPKDQCRTRVLTNLGVHHARNAETLSALFGVKFHEGKKRASRGMYMLLLGLPHNLREDMECDFLLLLDVEGLCSVPQDNENVLVHDNAMATFAIGLSDVLLHNIASHSEYELETNIAVIVSALLRNKECGSMPICELLVQDVGINSILQASQLGRVSEMLQPESDGIGIGKAALDPSGTTCISGPWLNVTLSEPLDPHYSEAVLELKENIFKALKKSATKSEAPSLPDLIKRLYDVWDMIKGESFSIGLQNTDIALAFSLLCTKLSKWNTGFLDNMEFWLMGATQKIVATKVKALDATVQNELLSKLKGEATEEVKTEVGKMKSEVEAYLMENESLKANAETFRPIFFTNMCNLQDRVTEQMIQKLETISESHCSSTQLENFQALLEKEQESVLHALVEKSRSTKVIFEDTELEEEFEAVWSKALSIFDFRPSETDDITARVIDILRENLNSRGLQKHIKKLDTIGENQTNGFQVYDEHFGYRSRLKHMFEDNNRLQRLKAQQLAGSIIEEYHQFVENKHSLLADFSDSYITELLENVEKALTENSLEIRSVFEVDLKVYLCNAASHDFQELHDRFAKDRELLTFINATKSMHSAEFIYNFRKRDQCHRLAQTFTSMVFKPTVLDFVNRPLGANIVEEILGKAQEYQSPQAIHKSLLEELIKEDSFESFLEYLNSFDNCRRRKIQKAVEAHISESTNIGIWRQQRLGEVVGKIAAAVSQTTEGGSGVLTDAKPLLEMVCLTLEGDGDVVVNKTLLNGPLFSFTTEWDRFVKYLMEFLATMRLNLVQEFSQSVDVTQLLDSLSLQPQDHLFEKVRGCDKQCPFCKAPCDEDKGHEVHKASLHLPIGMLPYDPTSLSFITGPVSMTDGNSDHDRNHQDASMTCNNLNSFYANWASSTEGQNTQKTNDYWRYVLARFNERFAEEFGQEPAKIPEDWMKLTQEDALDCLK